MIPKMKKTFVQKPADVKREWVLLDASEATIGRVANVAAERLIGKQKPTFTPHVDGGDYVVIINAKSVQSTGDKELAKRYWRHSGFPGGIKYLNLKDLRDKKPEEILRLAVKGMLPKNKLQAERMARLKIYADAKHSHSAQTPKTISLTQNGGAK